MSDGSNLYIYYVYILGLIRVHNLGAVFTPRAAWVLLVPLVRLVLFIALLLIVRSPLGQPAVCLAISDSPPPSLHDYSIQLDIWTQQCPILHDASSVPF